jgi:hypothetical protein
VKGATKTSDELRATNYELKTDVAKGVGPWRVYGVGSS